MARWLGALAALVAGSLLWALSPMVVHRREPWDAEWPFYLIVVVAAGMLSRILGGRWRETVLGFWLGQVAAIAMLGTADQRASLPVGVVTTGVGSLLTLPGWWAIHMLWRLIKLS